MCGIAGLFNLNGETLQDPGIASLMSARLMHRGPDEEGFMTDGPVAFGFRRLSIIDLETGNQPIPNEDGTVWVMFNGEIYNYPDLRGLLEKYDHRFRTRSDTEVIVHAYETFGLDFVDHLRGMFAIALWDSRAERLVLVRDRIGKKPLFYSLQNGQLAFASEVKAFLPWPMLDRTLDEKAIHDYLSLLYIPAPRSIFANIHKLPPAYLAIAERGAADLRLERYWNLSPAPDDSRPISYYAEGLREILAEAVRIRLRSDVPLGAFLSGGIDSTSVVGLMCEELPSVRTFSIGFPDSRFDETQYAALAASTFGSLHTKNVVDELKFKPNELVELVWYMDEPFADSSFIPTYWVSRAAREHVTVALSGDGGDELFAGYTRYKHFQLIQSLSRLPEFSKRSASALFDRLRGAVLTISPDLAERFRQIRKALQISSLESDEQILELLIYFDELAKAQLYSGNWLNQLDGYYTRCQTFNIAKCPGHLDPMTRFLTTDIGTGLVDDSLVKVDRASMACSLEVRSPFLDHKFVEFAMNIPIKYKLQRQNQKIILKRALDDVIPKPIMHREKQGFEVPFAKWFQEQTWQALLVDFLSESSLRTQGIFNPNAVMTLRDAVLNDPEAHNLPMSAYQLRHRVWMLMIFQIWYSQYMS